MFNFLHVIDQDEGVTLLQKSVSVAQISIQWNNTVKFFSTLTVLPTLTKPPLLGLISAVRGALHSEGG